MPINNPHTLYRFYDRGGALIYIGITNSMARRIREHGDDKPWYREAVRIDLEHFPDRVSVLTAEMNAIREEQPLYNIQHNHEYTQEFTHPDDQLWSFWPHQGGRDKVGKLWLYPEIRGSSVIDEWPGLDGEGQLHGWVGHVRREYPEQWDADAVPIQWFIRGATLAGEQIYEYSPFSKYSDVGAPEDFLAHYTQPRGDTTAAMLDWFQLPVINDSRPEFAKALGWTPSPFQPACPLRSIMSSRSGARSGIDLNRSMRHMSA